MFFLAFPDTLPQVIIDQQSTVIVADASASSPKSAVRKMTFGVCELLYATEDDQDEISNRNPLSPSRHMIEFLPKEIRNLLGPGTLSFVDIGGLDLMEWDNSFQITLLRAPEHGKFVNGYGEYLPNRDYIGKDRVDLLVEGRDDKGRPIALTLRYYINVLPREELHKISAEKGYSKALKKYCGATEFHWRISESQSLPNTLPGQTGDSSLSALLTGAQNVFAGLADLTGAAVAQTTGTGSNAQITFDADAAGHGWYIDYTPYLNEEYLPTSNPYEWMARPGSDAEGKMDLLSVLWHELGHAYGLDHTADSHGLMASTLPPGVRHLPNAEEWALLSPMPGLTEDVASVPASPDTPDATPAPRNEAYVLLRDQKGTTKPGNGARNETQDKPRIDWNGVAPVIAVAPLWLPAFLTRKDEDEETLSPQRLAEITGLKFPMPERNRGEKGNE
jgi:hypothetical protein